VPPPDSAETRHRPNRFTITITITKGHPMTQATAIPTTTATTVTPSGLRSLYLIRVVFSLIWVALVFATSDSLKSTDSPTVIAAVLLSIYPLWDVIATLLERRLAGTGVYAGHVAIGVWIAGTPGAPEGAPLKEPEDIARSYWDLHTGREVAERIISA
jgi:hypothetical protein